MLTRVMLWVFAIAITPWSVLHQHKPAEVCMAEKHCTHKVHVSTERDNCLICKAHFEKNYTIAVQEWHIELQPQPVYRFVLYEKEVFKAAVSSFLRGPPAQA